MAGFSIQSAACSLTFCGSGLECSCLRGQLLDNDVVSDVCGKFGDFITWAFDEKNDLKAFFNG